MAKSTKGEKHICQNCETRFFDLGKVPPVCPKCGTVVEAQKGKTKAKAAVEPPAPKTEEIELPDAIEAEDIDIEVDDDLESDDDIIEDTSDLGDDEVGDVITASGSDDDTD